MLPKAHLTSHSRISGSRWVIKSSWLSGSLRFFLYSSSVYSCHLFLIYFASVGSVTFLSYLCMKCSLGISNFLEEISRLSYSIVLLYFFALIIKMAFLSLLAILWNTTFKWVYLSFSPLPLACSAHRKIIWWCHLWMDAKKKRLTHPFLRLALPRDVLQDWRPFLLYFFIASPSLFCLSIFQYLFILLHQVLVVAYI